MVRIILDKSGVAVTDAILNTLSDKCTAKGLTVKAVVNEPNRALIIIESAVTSAFVVERLGCQDKCSCCRTCTAVYIRGVLPSPSVQPFRCMCGKWITN